MRHKECLVTRVDLDIELTPHVRLELLQDDVGRYLKENIGHKEDGQCYVVLC